MAFLEGQHTLLVLEILLVAALSWTVKLPTVPGLKKLARHKWAPLGVGVLALILRAAVLPVEPIPTPTVHDEFSYLLAADTFAHGRITNPTHPLWEFFETFHVDQFPTYASMYPPLSGLAMAAGQLATGIPFVGVWLSLGLLCAALTWGLRGWFSAEWAVLGGAIAAIRLGMFSYWANGYRGGALAAVGGALLFGALPRLIRTSRRRDALIAAIGVAMLANTRPYEGLAFSVAVGLAALWQARKLRLRNILPPFCAVLLCVGALMAWYNWRVFGSPAALPYSVNRATYAVAPYFIFQEPRPEPVYRHAAMRDFYSVWELGDFLKARTADGFLALSVRKLYLAWSFYIGPVLTLPLIALLWTWKSRRTRILVFMALVVAAFCSVIAFFGPHYIAPATVLIYALLIQGMRALRPRFPQAVAAIPAICVAMAAVRIGMVAAGIPPHSTIPMTWAEDAWSPVDRESTIAELSSLGGRHLVIVRYEPGHNGFAEYVYNGADIDGSPIVWARDMGAGKNAALLRYFSSRTVWLLDVGAGDPVLMPYPH